MMCINYVVVKTTYEEPPTQYQRQERSPNIDIISYLVDGYKRGALRGIVVEVYCSLK